MDLRRIRPSNNFMTDDLSYALGAMHPSNDYWIPTRPEVRDNQLDALYNAVIHQAYAMPSGWGSGPIDPRLFEGLPPQFAYPAPLRRAPR